MKAAMTAQMTTTISVLNVANTYHTLFNSVSESSRIVSPTACVDIASSLAYNGNVLMAIQCSLQLRYSNSKHRMRT